MLVVADAKRHEGWQDDSRHVHSTGGRDTGSSQEAWREGKEVNVSFGVALLKMSAAAGMGYYRRPSPAL